MKKREDTAFVSIQRWDRRGKRFNRSLRRVWLWVSAALLGCLSVGYSQAGTLAQFRFEGLGDVHVELFDNEKPITVANFLNLTRSGAYRFTFAHRLVPGFVIQGGGFRVENPNSDEIIGPAWENVGSVPHLGPIKNEYGFGQTYSNVFGTIAMAKLGGDPDSATSQWFFNLNDNASILDNQNGGFTVFGRVIGSGQEVLRQFNGLGLGRNMVNLQTIYGAEEALASVFRELPTFKVGLEAPPYNQLIYVTVTIAELLARFNDAGEREILWNSAGGITNTIEFAGSLGGPWEVLGEVEGTGRVMNLVDPSQENRFYRLTFAL